MSGQGNDIAGLDTNSFVPCPGCGREMRLLYRPMWELVPGFPNDTTRYPYAYILRPCVPVHLRCRLREQIGAAYLLPRQWPGSPLARNRKNGGSLSKKARSRKTSTTGARKRRTTRRSRNARRRAGAR